MFWNRDLPPELRDKKPEEIVEALKKLQELETKAKDFETSKAEMETKFNQQTTEFEQVRNKLQEMEQGVAAYQQQQQAQQQVQDQQPANVWNEPDRYIDQRTMPTQAMALHGGKMGAFLYFKDSLSPRDHQIFKKYQKEVEQTINAYQPAQQALPQNWFVAFNYVKGLHEQDIGKMEADNTPFFAEPGSRGAPPEPPPEEKLTDEEKEVCKRFHWDEKGYLQQKKAGAIHQAEKGAFARYPVPVRTYEDRR